MFDYPATELIVLALPLAVGFWWVFFPNSVLRYWRWQSGTDYGLSPTFVRAMGIVGSLPILALLWRMASQP
jgi:hypothetical protein